MKKRNRVLALFLVVILGLTSFTWDFCNAETANANNITIQAPQQGEVNFDNIDVLTLSDFTSTKFTRGGSGKPYNVVTGEIDQAVSKHWFSGNGTSTPYNGVSGVTGKNIGLKPKTNSDNDRYLLNTPYTYEEFTISTEIYWGVCAGIVIGEKNIYPNSADSSAVAIYFNNNNIQINGAVDLSTASVAQTNGAKWATSGSTGIFNFSGGKKATAGTAYTLNLKMQDGVLAIWVNGQDSILTIEASDTYKKGNIALLARKFGGDSGGLKSFAVQNLNASNYTDFDNVNISSLTGFTSTKFTRTASGQPFVLNGATNQTVSSYWFAGTGTGTPYEGASGVLSKNPGLKPRTNSDNDRYLLNTPYTYENFEISTKIYWGVCAGIVIGEKNVYPNSADSSAVAIYFNNNNVQINGAVDLTSASVTGGNAKWGTSGSTGILNFSGGQTATKGAVYTLNVKMQDGQLTIGVEGYAGVLTINTTNTYKKEAIAFFARKFGGDSGGLKSFAIQNLDVDGYVDFNDVCVSKMKGFTSTRFTRTGSGQPFVLNGTSEQTVSTHWFSGRGPATPYNGVSGVQSENIGIKPKTNSDNDRYLLNTPYTYENFEVSTEVYWGVCTGIVIGEKNVYPNSADSSAVAIYFNNNNIQINGAVDLTSASVTGGSARWGTSGSTGIFNFSGGQTATKGAVYTLNVKMQDGQLTIGVGGYAGVLTINTSSTYENGTFALLARKFGGDSGGLKAFSIKELEATVKPPAVQAQPGEGFTKSFEPVNDAFKVSSLDREFSSYYFASGTATGERGKVSDRWSYSNKTGEGLKPKHNTASGARTMLTYDKYIFTNVEIQAKYAINWADYSVMIAPEGQMASVANHGIKVWVESDGKMRVTGAIDAGTATASGGYVQALGQNMIRGYKIEGYSGKRVNGYYTLNVKVDSGVLYVWMDEIPDYIISVNVTEDYQGGVVSLYSTGNNSGGFGAISAVELPDSTTTSTAYTQSFNTIDSLSELKDFKAYKLDSVENKPEKVDIADIFLLNNGKLQAKSAANGQKDRTNFSILTLDKKEYKNFELTLKYEQARMQRYGVMFGTELGEFAYSQKGSRLVGNGGAYVYTEAEGYRDVRGSMVSSSYTQASEALYRKTGKPASFWWHNTDVMNNVQQKTLHTMTIRVVDNAMTMVIDNDESTRVTVRLDDYEGGYISLVSDAAAGDYGAFLYLAITELSDDAQLETTLPELSDGFETIKDVDNLFDAYYLKDAKETSKLEKVNLKDRWWLSDGGFVSKTEDYVGDQYTVTADVDVLTYTKQKFTDFEMTYTYQQNWQRLGVIIGEELGQYPLAYKNDKLKVNQGVLYYLEAQGQSNVQGNLNNWTADDERKFRVYDAELRPDGFVDATGQPTANIGAKKEHLVKVVVKDKQLYVFIDGNEKEAALHVFLGDDYKGGYVSLFAHAKKDYGFNHFSITDKVTTKLPTGSGTSSSDNVFTADFDTTKFDTSAFKTYYLEHTKGNATGKMKEDSFENQWTLDNGVLESNTQLTTPSAKNLTEFEWDDSTMVSVLTYNKKMKDFIVSYDYTKSWYRPMFMFGTELGKFALSAPNTTQHSQGVLIYPENDLGASGGLVALGNLETYTNEMRPMNRTLVKVEGYHEQGNWNSNVGTWHTMTVAVIDGHCYVYLDDYGMIADYELENYKGGYISLATSGRNYQYFSVNFDNFRITDLSNVGSSDIVSATNPKDLTVKVGTKLEDLKLPSTVQVTLDNGKKANVPVDWKPLKYNPDEEGVYQFTATPKGNNPAQVGARLYVKVMKKLPTKNKNVKEWTFDTPQDLKDFKVTYLKNAEKGYLKSDTPNWYVNSQGRLTRDPFRAVNGDQYKEVAIFSYAGEKYTNFELEVEYTQQWQRLMVLFGSEKPGQYIDLKDIYAKTNPVAGFVEMEGTRNFIGNLINANFDSNDKEKINNARESGVRVTDYYDKVLSGGNQGKKHTMKIRVVGDQAMMWIDNCKEPYVCTLTDYDGGYISLVTTCKSGSFDNLKITRLGATPKEVVKEQKVVANGTVNVDIDENADTQLVVPEKDAIKDAVNLAISPITYVVGGTTILLASLIGLVFILLASKKKK